MALEIKSPVFKDGEYIPSKYTCDGHDVSPPLTWNDPPNGTKSFALISDDPDAFGKAWVHWIVYDLPPDADQLPENIPGAEMLDNGAKQGGTDFGSIGYGGPCPPPGKPHRYVFKLYALDTRLETPPGMTKNELLKAMKGHMLEEAELVGLYER